MERHEHDNVELAYNRGSLKIVFKGKLVYDTSYVDDRYLGWQFEGCGFQMFMYNTVALEVTKDQRPELNWCYRIRRGETPNSFFPNLLNRLAP